MFICKTKNLIIGVSVQGDELRMEGLLWPVESIGENILNFPMRSEFVKTISSFNLRKEYRNSGFVDSIFFVKCA